MAKSKPAAAKKLADASGIYPAVAPGWASYRSRHRRRADREAHAEQAPPPPVLDHTLVPAGPPRLIQTQPQLLDLIDELRAAGRFGYDTEFIGEDTFYPRFCVVQVSTPQQVTLIDVLADGIDLQPFWELLAEPEVCVIVHAGLQDLEPVHRHTGKPPAHIFDTQLAAAFIGQPYPVSLTKLVTAVADADLGTSSKFSQWDRRPLTEVQQTYAANDVRYLHLLYRRINRRLDELGHTEKALAECELFSDESAYRVDPLAMKLKAKGVSRLKRKELAVVNALLVWRAEKAQKRNLPVRGLFDDQVLVNLGTNPVSNAQEVQQFKGLPWPVKEAYAQQIADLTQAALAGPLPKRTRSPKPLTDPQKEVLERLWTKAQAHCEAQSISPSIVFTKREIAQVVRSATSGKPLKDSRLTTGWRQELLQPIFDEVLYA